MFIRVLFLRQFRGELHFSTLRNNSQFQKVPQFAVENHVKYMLMTEKNRISAQMDTIMGI